MRIRFLSSIAALALVTAATAEPMPGLRGADHFGATVPDLAEAVAFFRDVIGCAEFYPLGPFADESGTWMADHLNVHPRARIEEMRLMRCGHGLNIELFQYVSPDQNLRGPRNSDIGGHHLAFYVDEMEIAVAHLRDAGVTVLGGPTTATEGPSVGETWVYFLAPWGLQLELVSYPDGRAYEAHYEGRLWAAKAPAQ